MYSDANSTIKGGTLKKLVLIIAVIVALSGVSASNAHGPHHSWVMPAFDCYKGTEGFIVVTKDTDRNRFIKWKCICVNTAQTGDPKWVCWWKIIQIKHYLKEINIPSNTAKYQTAYLTTRLVKWLAWHGEDSCIMHYARKTVILVKPR